MPIYEYYCGSCKKEFELMRPLSQMGDPAPCSSCGAEGQRLISAFASKVDYYIKASTKPPFRQPADSQRE